MSRLSPTVKREMTEKIRWKKKASAKYLVLVLVVLVVLVILAVLIMITYIGIDNNEIVINNNEFLLGSKASHYGKCLVIIVRSVPALHIIMESCIRFCFCS